MALRNLRAGRGDRRSARRLATYVFVIAMGTWLFTADHVRAVEEWFLVVTAFGRATGAAVMAWILYMAIEPYARRHWPRAMISWTRLLAGRLRDPLVGRDVLLGCLCGACLVVAIQMPYAATVMTGGTPPVPWLVADTDSLLGGRYVLGQIFAVQTGILVYLGAFVLLLALRILLRKPWLGTAAFALIVLSLVTSAFTEPVPVMLGNGVAAAILVLCMVRFGLLATVVLSLFVSLLIGFPVTFDLSAWYAGIGLVGILLAVALPACGFWISLAGRPLFRDELSEA